MTIAPGAVSASNEAAGSLDRGIGTVSSGRTLRRQMTHKDLTPRTFRAWARILRVGPVAFMLDSGAMPQKAVGRNGRIKHLFRQEVHGSHPSPIGSVRLSLPASRSSSAGQDSPAVRVDSFTGLIGWHNPIACISPADHSRA
ncbi:hypothetical protein GCM10010151_54010 [Actinoallomurus spadix]|uniref:Transposase n=1 Tax=Actinoallomurus spadix TaxID=79912 RepID=A0ABN0X840_9ACTN